MRPAVFLDRDGTIIEERHYLADPEQVRLLPGAIIGLRTLAEAGFALVIITNQSGIARGLYTEAEFRAVQLRLGQLLEAEGIGCDGVYHCPHHPEFTGACSCRKPAPGLFQQAQRELRLDMARSAFVGDRLTDLAPASELGGLGVLVRTGYGAAERLPANGKVRLAVDLAEAAEIILQWRAATLQKEPAR